MSNGFVSYYENKGRFYTSKMLDYLNCSYNFSENVYEKYDVTFSQNNKKFLGEIKVRDCFITTYSDYIFEKTKYIEFLKHKNTGFYYINYFNTKEKNKKIAVFFNVALRKYLQKNEYWQTKMLVKNSFNTLEEVKKSVTFLKIDKKKYKDLVFYITLNSPKKKQEN